MGAGAPIERVLGRGGELELAHVETGAATQPALAVERAGLGGQGARGVGVIAQIGERHDGAGGDVQAVF